MLPRAGDPHTFKSLNSSSSAGGLAALARSTPLLVALFTVVATSALAGLGAPPAAAEGSVRGVTDATLLQTRGPIEIESDADFTPANGVRSGSGTEADPFVISGWRIVGTGKYGVEVKHTTAHFEIREVLVDRDGGADFVDGFWLYNVTGGMLDHVEARGMPRYGIYFGWSDGTRVCESAVRWNGFVGMYAHQSTNLLWLDNLAHDNLRHGFYFANWSTENRVTGSEAYNHLLQGALGFGIYSGIGADNNTMDNNTLHDNGAGLQVNLVAGNVIRDNTVTRNANRGISITLSTDLLVHSNVVHGNTNTGILLAQSERVSTVDNDVRDHAQFGIDVVERGNHDIHGNHVRDSNTGIHFSQDSPNSLAYNNFFSNWQNVLDENGSQTWNVTKQPGPNIIGGAWLGGNYWSDVTDDYHDHDEDGLAESHGPYRSGIVQGGDYLPLVGANGAPHAAFNVSNPRPDSNELVVFTDVSQAGAFPIVNWTWEFHDGARAYTQNASRTFSASGAFTVVLRVRDAIGLASTASALITVQNVLPVPVLAGPLRMVTTDGLVALDARGSFDPDGRIVNYEWTLGDGAVERGGLVFHAYAQEGAYAGSLLVVDDRQGSRALGFLVVFDRTAPATDGFVEGTAGDAGWLVGNVTARFVARDLLSGVERTEWRSDAEAPWETYAGPIALPDGEHALRFRSVDRAGNVEAERALAARVDATAPVTTLVAPALAGPGTLLSLSAADAGSGVDRTFYRLPGEAGARVFESTFTLAGQPDGDVAILAWSEDEAGNVESTREFHVVFDATPPEVAIVAPSNRSITLLGITLDAPAYLGDAGAPEASIVVGRARVRSAVADATSGLARVVVSADGVVLFDGASGFEEVAWEVPADGLGYRVLRLEAWDLVGNHASTERGVVAVPSSVPALPS